MCTITASSTDKSTWTIWILHTSDETLPVSQMQLIYISYVIIVTRKNAPFSRCVHYISLLSSEMIVQFISALFSVSIHFVRHAGFYLGVIRTLCAVLIVYRDFASHAHVIYSYRWCGKLSQNKQEWVHYGSNSFMVESPVRFLTNSDLMTYCLLRFYSNIKAVSN